MLELNHILLAACSGACLLIRQRTLIYGLVLFAFAIAFYSGLFSMLAGIWTLCLMLLVYSYYNLKLNTGQKVIVFVPLTFFLAGFTLHELPGFSSQMILNNITISAGSKPFTMSFFWDKFSAGLIVYALSLLWKQEKIPDRRALRQTLLIWLACVTVILAPAILTSYVRFDPKWPSIIWLWAMHNLLFICFAEEVIFRGFLQRELQQLFVKRHNALWPIVLASIIFGLAHYKHGQIYMALAALAGLFYGYAYHRTNRIVCSMLVHFGLNLAHLLFFSYPAALKI